MPRRMRLAGRAAVAALAMIGGSVIAAEAVDHPSIIFIMSDDQAPGMTGFEGHPVVETPHLDALAAEGVHFTRCYTPTPQSAASRGCVLTGQYPHTNGLLAGGGEKSPTALPPSADTFTARLKRAGYACGIVGQWQLPVETSKRPGFGLVDYVATDGEQARWQECPVWVQGEKATADKFLTDWHGDRAIEFVEKSKDGPFFLWLCFRAPHGDPVYPPGFEKKYPLESVDMPRDWGGRQTNWQGQLAQADAVKAFRGKQEKDLRDLRSRYCAMITRLDENVGRLLKRMDELGLREKTIVVFTSDGGWMLGEHSLLGDGPFFHEELVRCPLLVRYPGVSKPGSKIHRVVSLVDLAPTFCRFAGLEPPVTMHGRSLLPLLEDPDTSAWAEECFFEYDAQNGKPYPVRGVVAQQYKFIDYLKDNDVLYDLKRDPGETSNILDNRADRTVRQRYEPIQKVLQSRLDNWRAETKDPSLPRR